MLICVCNLIYKLSAKIDVTTMKLYDISFSQQMIYAVNEVCFENKIGYICY